MSKLIDQQVVIDAVEAMVDKSGKGEIAGFYNAILERVIDKLNDLLPAQPMRWIPCSERFPEDGTSCLVSVRCLKEFVLVDMGTYSTDLSKVDEENFFGERGKSGWYYINSEYGYCRILNVIAWMPLPEPYKEVKE